MILALDTSTDACSAALLCADWTLTRFQICPRGHAALILPMIEQILTEADCQPEQINAIAVGRGPGSFMGVRIAAGVAQGLAYAWQKPIVGISSLQALAQQAYEEQKHEQVLAGWDARMQQIYWGRYQAEDGLMQPMCQDQLSSPEAIPMIKKADLICVGNAWQVYADQLQQNDLPVVKGYYPHALAVAKLGLAALTAGESMSAFDFVPAYLRNNIAHKLSDH